LKAPRISVVIPTFNRSEFLRNCLKSLQASGIDELQIIVVDDGSTEDIRSVVMDAAPQAIYLSQNNQGPAAARNLGFHHSTGTYVCFLDSDDEWLPKAPVNAVDFLDRHPEVDILFADTMMGSHAQGFVSFVETFGGPTFHELPHILTSEGCRILNRDRFLQRLLERNVVFLGSMYCRRHVPDTVGLFDTRLCGAADWNLFLRLANVATFAYWPTPLSIYTQHEAGMSRDDAAMHREFCDALLYLSEQTNLSPDARQVHMRQLRKNLFGYAYRAYDNGEYAEARKRFGKLLHRCGWELPGLAYWIACRTPGPLIRGLRRIKHHFKSEEVESRTAPAGVINKAVSR
jgi:glycosyltransferase involved in cell wall biosynthesis